MLGARVQPQGGQVRLSALARSLGFTYAFNFGSGSPITPNLITGKQALSLIQGASASGGPGGRAVQLTGTLGDRLEVAGNPFSTSTCTYLWIDSGVDSTANGQCVVQTRYGQTAANEQYGLQVRIIGSEIHILSAQFANRVTANGRDNTGGLNASAVSIASADGRHAVFNRGQMLYGAAPPSLAQQYIHGTNAIGAAFDCTSSTVKFYALLFAPRALPDEALKYLTANPGAAFEDASDDHELFAAYAVQTASASIAWTDGDEAASATAVATDRAAVVWTEGSDSASMAGTVTDRATLAWAEQGDTASLVGAVAAPAPAGVTAAVSWMETGDTASIGARLTDQATVAWAEQGDVQALTAHAETPPIINLTVRFKVLRRDFRTKITHFSK